MKKGFTMIELIFVIVILGILAAVAIPRLAATRDDAEVAKTLSNLSTMISDVTSNYTAQGEFAENIDQMTNVTGVASGKGSSATLSKLNTEAVPAKKTLKAIFNFKVGKDDDCVLVSFIKNDQQDVNLYVGTEKLLKFQDAVALAKSDVAEKQRIYDSNKSNTAFETDLNKSKATLATKEKELKDALEARGGIAKDKATAQCRTLTSTNSFKDMAGKEYKLSGSNVRF